MNELTPEQKTAVKCCAMILAVDSTRGNEAFAAKTIADIYDINLDKLKAGEYDV
jgi:hypothetical protein